MKSIIIKLTALVFGLSLNVVAHAQWSDWIAPKSANDLKNPFKDDPASVALGQQLFSTICFVCHGNKGKGDGINAPSLAKKPADLTSARVQRQSDGILFWKISEGNPPMLSFKESLSEEQRWAVVNYIRKLGGRTSKPDVAATKEKTKTKKQSIPKTPAKIADKEKRPRKSESKKAEPAAPAPETAAAPVFNPFEGVTDGKVLFKNICGACHTIGKGKLIGPDLKGATAKHDREWLYKWVRSSQSMVRAGDPEAVRLFNENDQKVMNDHQYLTDEQIENVLQYIEAQTQSLASAKPAKTTASKTTGTGAVQTVSAKPAQSAGSVYDRLLRWFVYVGFAFVLIALLHVSLVLTKMVK